MIDLIPQAAAYAAVIAAVVEAIRSRVAVDGWRVLVLAGVVALALAALFLPATDLPSLLSALRVAALAWLLAVGGDAWLSKLATKSQARINTILTSTPDEALRPTTPPAPREEPDQ
jgi:hypothetical protein